MVAPDYQIDQRGYPALEVRMVLAGPLQDGTRLADLSIESDHGAQGVVMV